MAEANPQGLSVIDTHSHTHMHTHTHAQNSISIVGIERYVLPTVSTFVVIKGCSRASDRDMRSFGVRRSSCGIGGCWTGGGGKEVGFRTWCVIG